MTRRRVSRAPALPIEAVTTDLWYTLCYLSPADRRSIGVARHRAWADPLERARFSRPRALGHVRALEHWNLAQERLGRAPPIHRQAAWLAERTGVPIAPAEAADRLDASLRAVSVRPAPRVRWALDELRAAGVRLGLVSNLINETSASAERILEQLGLGEYYASRQFSSDLPWSKPDPRPFRRCLQELGVAPAASVHVGDLALDRRGARRAGMRAICYTGLHRQEFGGAPPPSERPGAATPAASSWDQVIRLLRRSTLGPTPNEAPAGRPNSRSVPSARKGLVAGSGRASLVP